MFDVRSLVLFLWHRQKNYNDLQIGRIDLVDLVGYRCFKLFFGETLKEIDMRLMLTGFTLVLFGMVHWMSTT